MLNPHSVYVQLAQLWHAYTNSNSSPTVNLDRVSSVAVVVASRPLSWSSTMLTDAVSVLIDTLQTSDKCVPLDSSSHQGDLVFNVALHSPI